MQTKWVWVSMGVAAILGVAAVARSSSAEAGKEAVVAVMKKQVNDCESEYLNRSRCAERRVAGVPGLVRSIYDGPTEQCREVYLKENGEPYGVIAVPCKVVEKAFTAAASGD